MRFVPVRCLKEGMILGKNLLGKNFELLLRQGNVLTKDIILRIMGLQYTGVYIHDELSQDIQVEELISDTIKAKVLLSVKNLFMPPTTNLKTTQDNFDKTKMLVVEMIDKILNNKDLMINMVDMKVFDEYTYYHSVHTAMISILLGVALGLNKTELYELGLASLLHDIGKVFIDKEILNKNGKLTDEEFVTMKTHSEHGYRYLKDMFEISAKIYVGVLQHHERYDGMGYPHKKKGEEISLFGRIIAIADVYDALTSDRPYRKAMLPSEAMEYIMGCSGTHFDPKIVQVFLKKVAPYPLGTCVRLSDGTIGIVIKNTENYGLRPSIKIIKQGEQSVEPYIVHLVDKDALHLTIISIVDC